MPDQGTSPLARLVAIAGLIVVFIAVIAVIAVSGGGNGDEGDDSLKDSGPDITAVNEPDKDDEYVQNALDRGEYIVRPGDTLVSIAEATGIDIETLEQLNPGLDPQQLPERTRLRLK